MKLRKYILISAAALSLWIVSCNKIKDFGDINVDPNRTEVPSTAALLTNVLSQLGGYASQTRGGLYAQQFSETQYTEVSLYALPRLDFDGIYAGPLYDLQNIININTDDATKGNAIKFGSNNNQIAIARILKAYIFWTVTDRWGDVPYFEALQGNENLSPKYDPQELIYKDLIKELKEASDQFDAGATVVGDIVYSGSAAKWKKAANSLRMLIALRTSKVYPAPGEWAATEFAAAYNDADGYIATNADNLTINYTGSVNAFRNPFWLLYNGRTDFAESKFMTDLMASLGDPRQTAFGSNTSGFPYGLTREQAIALPTSYAQILSSSWRATNSPLTVIGADDVRLAIAEAAFRNWISANVASNYRAAIEQSWAQWGVSSDIDIYMARSAVALTGDPADLQKIHLQQYIAWYPDGLQAWSNWRRTGVPSLTPTVNALNSSKQIPRRYTYGSNEYSLNASNVSEAVSRLQGGDVEVSRVWWDKP